MTCIETLNTSIHTQGGEQANLNWDGARHTIVAQRQCPYEMEMQNVNEATHWFNMTCVKTANTSIYVLKDLSRPNSLGMVPVKLLLERPK